jgi:hypothetical protein
MWRLQISLFGILFAIILAEATIIPSIWAPLRVDFFIGMIIGQIIYIPFSQGFPFVILSALILQAFSGARLGMIPLLYILSFLAIEFLKNLVYLENSYTQIVLGIGFYLVLMFITAVFTDLNALEGKAVPLIAGALFSGGATPAIVKIVYRLQLTYES